MCIHKWIKKDNQPKYEYLECEKCKKRRIKELFKGGYQPLKHPNWEN
jgi:hypothetical protein